MRNLIVERKNKGRVFTLSITGSGNDLLSALAASIKKLAQEKKLQVFNRADALVVAPAKKKRTRAPANGAASPADVAHLADLAEREAAAPRETAADPDAL